MNLLVIGVFIVFTAEYVLADQRTQEATYLCYANETDGTLLHFIFRVLANSDLVIQVVPYDASSSLWVGKKSSCTTTYGNGTTESPFELTITVDTDDPLAVSSLTSTCGIQEITQGQLYKFRIRTIGDLDLDLGTDAFYDCHCDMSNLLTMWTTVGPVFTITSTETVTLQEIQVGAALRLLDSVTGLPVTVVELGSEVYLQLIYNPQTQDNNAFDSCGTSFWVVFPDSSSPDLTSSFYLHAISATSVKIQVRFWSSATEQAIDTVIIDPFAAANVSVPAALVNDVILVTTTDKIYLNLEVLKGNNKHCMTVNPTDTFGLSYDVIVPGVNSSVTVVGTQDQTIVNFTAKTMVTVDGSLVSEGETISTVIEAFEIMTISSSANDFTGSTLLSSAPVTIFTGYDSLDDNRVLDVDQLVPTTKLGSSFVIPNGTGKVKCVSPNPDITTVTYTGTPDVTMELSQNQQLSILMDPSEFFELKADNALSCLLLFDTESSYAVTLIPPFQQWSKSYIVYTDISETTSTNLYIVIRNGSESGIRVNKDSLVSAVTSVRHLTTESDAADLVSLSIRFPSSMYSPTSVYHTSESFMVLVVHTDGDKVISATVPPGVHLSDILINGDPSCSPTSGYRGDLVDNDCDGFVDEDTDTVFGNSYPDLQSNIIDNIHPVRVRPVDCNAKPNSVWTDEGIFKTVVDSVGCVPSGIDRTPFSPDSTFAMVTNSTTYPIVYNTGIFNMPRFENQADVYIRCRLEFCFRLDDTSCTSDICKARKKRDVRDESNTANVDLHVTVTESHTGSSEFTQGKTSNDLCMKDQGFLGVLGALGLLTVIAIGITLYLYCRVKKVFEES